MMRLPQPLYRTAWVHYAARRRGVFWGLAPGLQRRRGEMAATDAVQTPCKVWHNAHITAQRSTSCH